MSVLGTLKWSIADNHVSLGCQMYKCLPHAKVSASGKQNGERD